MRGGRVRQLILDKPGLFEANNVKGSCKTTCESWVNKLLDQDDSLKLAISNIGNHHYFIVLADGTMVDPTIDQFFNVPEVEVRPFIGNSAKLLAWVRQNTLEYGFNPINSVPGQTVGYLLSKEPMNSDS